jgi:hypothetical protein
MAGAREAKAGGQVSAPIGEACMRIEVLHSLLTASLFP